MAAGLIGLLSGGALGFAASKYRQKEQQKQQLQQFTLKGYMDDAEQNPEIVNNPEWEKAFRKTIGDSDAADAAMEHFKAHAGAVARQRQTAQQFMQSIFGMPQGGASGPGGAGPTPAAPTGPTPVMASRGPGQPAAGTAPQGNPAASPTAAPGRTDYSAQLRQLEMAKAGLGTMGLDPEMIKSMTSSIDDRIKDLQHQQDVDIKQQDFDQTRADRLMMHADTEADRAAQRQMMAAVHQETLGMQQQNKDFMQQLAQERADDQRQAHFQTATQSLATQTKNIATMLTAANPADPATVRTLLNARNAQARQLKQFADKNGLEYDADQFKPMTTKTDPGYLSKLTGGAIGGGTTSLTEDTRNDPLIGKSTSKADGTYDLNGKHYTVKGGKIVAGN